MSPEEFEAIKIKARNRLRLLSSFDDADGVAQYLEDNGFKGYQIEACNCPVTNFVRDGMPSGIDVSSSCESTVVRDLEDGSLREQFIRDRNTPIAEFIAAFDNGDYPQLVAE